MARPRLSKAEKARRARERALNQGRQQRGAARTTQSGMQFIRCPIIGGQLYVPTNLAGNLRGQ